MKGLFQRYLQAIGVLGLIGAAAALLIFWWDYNPTEEDSWIITAIDMGASSMAFLAFVIFTLVLFLIHAFLGILKEDNKDLYGRL